MREGRTSLLIVGTSRGAYGQLILLTAVALPNGRASDTLNGDADWSATVSVAPLLLRPA